MAKPIQLTKVKDVPLNFSGACLATSEENNGESAVPSKPQENRKISTKHTDLLNRNTGESRQHKPESESAIVAIRFAPNFCDSTPATMQEMPPEAIIKKENSETFIDAVGCVRL